MNTRAAHFVAPLFILVCAGCTTVKETFKGEDPDQVWSAMVASANTPGYYGEWFLVENNVWSDDAQRRIEVYRIIERDRVLPESGNAQHEKREMHQTIRLVEGKEGPTIKFVSRAVNIPVNARDDARLYFEDVWNLLAGAAPPQGSPDDAAPPADATEPPPAEGDGATEIIDIDDVG